jgi:hypothetical protein
MEVSGQLHVPGTSPEHPLDRRRPGASPEVVEIQILSLARNRTSAV